MVAFITEYTDRMSEDDFLNNVCPKASNLKYTAILKERDLNKFVVNCN